MKTKILEALKTKFIGVDEQFLAKKAEKMAKTISKEEEISTAVDGVTFQSLLDSYKDTYVTDAVKTAIGNYETKYGIKDGKPVEQNPPTPPVDPSTPQTSPNPELTALLQSQAEQIRTLSAAVTAMQTKSVTEQRTAKLAEILKSAPEALKAQYQGDFERMSSSFKDDNDFDTWLGSTKTNVETMVNAMNAQGGIFTPPTGGGKTPPNGVNPLVQARANERANAYASNGSAIKGLPTQPSAPIQTGQGSNQ